MNVFYAMAAGCLIGAVTFKGLSQMDSPQARLLAISAKLQLQCAILAYLLGLGYSFAPAPVWFIAGATILIILTIRCFTQLIAEQNEVVA